ncbi:hypothetical protein BH11MYX1_BH11MYX1_43540 [soil metagenome]
MWGGRLGTNLIELGLIDLDELSRALGRQHELPAALARHFDRADPALQAELPAELAERYGCVPLLHLADGKIALAGMDPIDAEGLAEIAAALGVEPSELVMSIAAEQRMRYQLERVYQIARDARYLRSRGGTIPPFPVFGDFQDEADSDVEIPIDFEIPIADLDVGDSMSVPIAMVPDAVPALAEVGDDDLTVGIPIPRADPDALSAALEQAVASAADPQAITGRERRTYVRTLGDGAADPAAPRPHQRRREPSRPKKALGRIAIKRAVVPTGSDAAIEARGGDEAFEQLLADTLGDAAKNIRRSPDRDRVAELVIDALVRFAPTADAAMLFVIRGGSATGWKYFRRSSSQQQRGTQGGNQGADRPELAVPMDQPGLVPQAVTVGKTCRGAGLALGALDTRLLAELEPAFSDSDGSRELAVVPIAIAGKVMCVLAVATTPGASMSPIETIAIAAGTAFGRLMRDAGR